MSELTTHTGLQCASNTPQITSKQNRGQNLPKIKINKHILKTGFVKWNRLKTKPQTSSLGQVLIQLNAKVLGKLTVLALIKNSRPQTKQQNALPHCEG